jgi:hypothetical protein
MIMSHQCQIIVEQAQRLATEMPLSMVERLAAAIEKVAPSHWPAVRGDILQTLSHPYYRALATGLFDAWQVETPDLTPQTVAMALALAAATATTRRASQTVERAPGRQWRRL